MKKLMFIILGCILLTSCNQTANSIANTTANFKVWGNCNMCKETIEGSLKVDGVSKAEWQQLNQCKTDTAPCRKQL